MITHSATYIDPSRNGPSTIDPSRIRPSNLSSTTTTPLPVPAEPFGAIPRRWSPSARVAQLQDGIAKLQTTLNASHVPAAKEGIRVRIYVMQKEIERLGQSVR